jgi:hypothetical protein
MRFVNASGTYGSTLTYLMICADIIVCGLRIDRRLPDSVVPTTATVRPNHLARRPRMISNQFSVGAREAKSEC